MPLYSERLVLKQSASLANNAPSAAEHSQSMYCRQKSCAASSSNVSMGTSPSVDSAVDAPCGLLLHPLATARHMTSLALIARARGTERTKDSKLTTSARRGEEPARTARHPFEATASTGAAQPRRAVARSRALSGTRTQAGAAAVGKSHLVASAGARRSAGSCAGGTPRLRRLPADPERPRGSLRRSRPAACDDSRRALDARNGRAVPQRPRRAMMPARHGCARSCRQRLGDTADTSPPS